jgi:hypothetical protein
MPGHISRRELLLASAIALGGPPLISQDAPGADRNSPYQPWATWVESEPGVRGLVHAAILAANAHNTQPWLFCAGQDRIEVRADETRNLGTMDPFRREMHISIGCAVQNLLLAANAQGNSGQLTIDNGSLDEPKPGTRSRPVALIKLAADTARISPLLRAIPERHTNRAAYDPGRPLSQQDMAELATLSDQRTGARLVLLTDPKVRADFAAATVQATRDIIGDQAMIADSDAWFRASAAEIAKHRDGPTIDAAGLSRFVTLLAKMLPAPSPERAHNTWLEHTRDVQLATAPLFGVIEVKDLYDRGQAVHAGMLWQRLHLQATLSQLAAQPLNQLPELVDRERQLGTPAHTGKLLAKLLGDPEWHVTFAFRVGWPTRSVGPSPRRGIEAVIEEAGC